MNAFETNAVEASYIPPPTLREELDRKVYETLEWLIVGYDKGRLTQEQVSMGMDTLFMAVAGLVNGDFLRIITEAKDECQSSKSVVRRVFHAPAGAETVSLTWTPGESKIIVTKRICGQAVRSFVRDKDDAKGAKEYLSIYSDGLIKRGWIEL